MRECINDETPLEIIIRAEINDTGFVSVERYMSLCLSHPEHGFYMKDDVLGKDGSFTTAPEICQVFGELIGVWLVQVWQDTLSAKPFVLLEAGPGRGTLMADALRVASRICPDFIKFCSLYLLEINPEFRFIQSTVLRQYNPVWIENVHELPNKAMLVVANEFFDSLPVGAFILQEGVWQELCVVAHRDSMDLAFSSRSIDDSAQELFDDPVLWNKHLCRELPEGAIYEVCFSGRQLAGALTEHFHKYGGQMLVIDYGYDAAMRDAAGWRGTLQAVNRHQFVDALCQPGVNDLTAHVDFDALRWVVNQHKGHAFPLETQGDFLGNLGVYQRVEQLCHANSEKSGSLALALRRLVHPSAMGALFRVFIASAAA